MKMPKPLKKLLTAFLTPEGYRDTRTAIFRILPHRAKAYRLYRNILRGKVGFEIGGPSPIFQKHGKLPVYILASRIDNCNFSHSTTWESSIREGLLFTFDASKVPGYQYVREATGLKGIASGTYDCVLSSHNIEHIANPLHALEEWSRILRPRGLLVLVAPHREGTFDHRRPATQLAHMVDDYERGVTEDDLTHLPEILDLHDLSMDDGVATFAEFKERSERNSENRCLHHHVFETETVVRILDHAWFCLRHVEALRPFSIIAIAEKLPEGTRPDNEKFLDLHAPFRQRSPFVADRKGA